MTDPMQQARELSSPESIGFRLRNLAQNMAAGSEPVARDHQAWKRVEELAEAVAALRAAPECAWTHDADTDSWDSACGAKWQFNDGGPAENNTRFCHSCGGHVAARPQGVKDGR